MFCAISGEPPAVPVISSKSGFVYEKRLILKYLEENRKDPVTGEELSEEDLVEVKANPRMAVPRPPTMSSIPALLASLQNEYDATMLELFTLKKSYDSVRQELAHALYANDAANRVVARLMSERDEARSALANIQGTLGGSVAAPAAAAEHAEMADAGGLPAAIAAKIEETAASLSSQRKAKSKRKAPEGYATAADVQNFKVTTTIPSMHSTKPPGVSALDVSLDGKYLLTGGNDKQVQVFDRASEKTLATLKGHTKRITRVAFSKPQGTAEIGAEAGAGAGAPQYAVTASEDNSVRVWQLQEDGKAGSPSYALAHTLKGYKAAVTGLDFHPCGSFIGSASRDGTWALHDLATGERLLVVDAPTGEAEEEAAGGYSYESFAFHPDGQLAATGTSGGALRIWDVRAVQKVSSFQGHAGKGVHALSFSENGYYLAAASKGSAEVKVWDLRKLSVAGTISASSDEGGQGEVNDVRFDPSAQLLAVGGSDVRVYANKSWNLVVVDDSNTAEVTAVRWDATNGNLVTASADRTVRVLGPDAA